ncbi:MAG: serine/threonine protein kinase, partial [Chloroflexota bacterium]|nr:serine/threonine protein kinase [Chloroflexota bacterium]
MALDGKQIGRYQLQHLLGRGGMGEVYLATDTRINRQVAMKVIREEAGGLHDTDSFGESARLFQREVKAIAGLDNSHILPLFDYGEKIVDGLPLTYMVMPYRPEGTLTTWLRQRGQNQLPPQDVANIVRQAADALQYAHDRQIVHQDVKPANFLIRSLKHQESVPDLLLADFGVAKFTSTTSNMSQSIRGTPTYMAPEQWQGQAVPATDQYALAVMAYELLTGQSLFQGSMGQIMYKHVYAEPPAPSSINPRLSQDIDRVLLTALSKKPEQRFYSIAAFANAFSQAVQLPQSQNQRNPVTPIYPDYNVDPNLNIPTLTVQDMSGLGNTPPIPQQIASASPLVEKTMESRPSYQVHSVGTVSSNLPPLANAPRPPRNKVPIAITVLIVLLILVIIGGGFYFVRNAMSGSNLPVGTTPAVAQRVTPISTSASTPSPNPTNASTDPYTHQGKLAFTDSLNDNSQGHAWMEGVNSLGASCSFTGGAYSATQPNANYFHACRAQATDLSNFVFEVQMVLTSGDYEGIIFRVDPTSTNDYYYFKVDQSGNYYLIRSVNAT